MNSHSLIDFPVLPMSLVLIPGKARDHVAM